MSTVLDEPNSLSDTMAAQRLRTTMAAVRVSLSWLGVRKTLTAEQKNQAADTFGATGDYLSVGKKLLDTKHPSFKAVHEDELLVESELGQLVLKLRQEKEYLLDTVWLACSAKQIKELWGKVAELLNDEQTQLQRAALTIAPVEE